MAAKRPFRVAVLGEQGRTAIRHFASLQAAGDFAVKQAKAAWHNNGWSVANHSTQQRWIYQADGRWKEVTW